MTKERKKQTVAATERKNEQNENKEWKEKLDLLEETLGQQRKFLDAVHDAVEAVEGENCKFRRAVTDLRKGTYAICEEKTEEGDGLDKYMKKAFKKELLTLINTYCMEADSDTPDYILAEYMIQCLKLFNKSTQARDMHMGIK